MRIIAMAMSVILVSVTPLQAWAQLTASRNVARVAALDLMADFDDDPPATAPSPAVPKEKPQPAAHAALPVPLVPARIDWAWPRDGDPWALFDGRASTGLTQSTSGAVGIVITLREATELGALTVLGPAHGTLTIQNGDSEDARPVPGWEAIDLDLKEGQWKRVPTAGRGPMARHLVTTWVSDDANGPKELGIWGFDVPSRDAMDRELADRILAGPAAGAVTAHASPEEGHPSRVELGAGAPVGRSSDAVFTAHLGVDPRALSRAFLVYELTGLGHWTETIRRINGLAARGGALPPSDRPNEGGLQVEEISPSWLRPGDNEVRFLAPVSPGVPGYGVRHVRLVGVGHATLLESRLEATGSGKQLEGHLAFGVSSQPHELAFDLLEPSEGRLLVSPRGKDSRPLRVDLHGLEAGWHRVALDAMPSTTALEVDLSTPSAKVTRGCSEARSPALGEVAITASPRDSREGRLVVSYPLHGECVNHAARVRGFAETLPGNEVRSLRASAAAVETALDGSFALEIPEPPNARGGRWEVPIEAVLSDGATLRERLEMQPCLDSPTDTGLEEDDGAPFHQVVRAGEPATVAFAGTTLEIPAGAVDQDVNLSIRPLVADQVPRMSAGIANVSPSGGAFRFGPHGLKFKKPIKITLPYDARALRHGARERQIFSFFYDEPHGKWTRIGRYGSPQDGALTSLTEHFTDFINATIAIPDESAPQSFNPNDMKGARLGDPAAGLDLIAPPQANSFGTATLSYPLELPPGRNGIEPKLAFTYNQARGDGWLGVGWDLRLSSIEIDTRFGVPQYTGNETYLLDGEQLTPSPAGNNLYVRRVEGRFDQIQRNIDGNSCVTSWTVTSKSGTIFQYGGAGATLSDPHANTTCRNFRWHLTSVTDTYGNGLSITYFTDTGNNGDPFVELYPQTIDYTTSTRGAGLAVYRVSFVL
ncbi:MAG: hypothetical protein FWD17_07330, partial [Polyangiaceae bacterium]|nr:hypothetical protein [Polyangiaceae bacterium]